MSKLTDEQVEQAAQVMYYTAGTFREFQIVAWDPWEKASSKLQDVYRACARAGANFLQMPSENKDPRLKIVEDALYSEIVSATGCRRVAGEIISALDKAQ